MQGGGVWSTMQLVSWAALLTLLVRELVEMGHPEAAAVVRKDRLHPRQGKLRLWVAPRNPHPATHPLAPCS